MVFPRRKKLFIGFLGLSFLCFGCAHTAQTGQKKAPSLLNTSQEESVDDAAAALTAISGAVSNKEISQEDLYQAAKDMRNDPEAQSAVEAISSAFEGNGGQVKYSPATGKRYSADMEIDPETGVKLLPVE